MTTIIKVYLRKPFFDIDSQVDVITKHIFRLLSMCLQWAALWSEQR